VAEAQGKAPGWGRSQRPQGPLFRAAQAVMLSRARAEAPV